MFLTRSAFFSTENNFQLVALGKPLQQPEKVPSELTVGSREPVIFHKTVKDLFSPSSFFMCVFLVSKPPTHVQSGVQIVISWSLSQWLAHSRTPGKPCSWVDHQALCINSRRNAGRPPDAGNDLQCVTGRSSSVTEGEGAQGVAKGGELPGKHVYHGSLRHWLGCQRYRTWAEETQQGLCENSHL